MKHPQIENSRQLAVQAIKDYPHLTSEIKELWALLMSEIENGESIHHECELFNQDVIDLITEDEVN